MADHRLLRFILTERAFATIRRGTKQWLAECPCGHKRDLWDGCRSCALQGDGKPQRTPVVPRLRQDHVAADTQEDQGRNA